MFARFEPGATVNTPRGIGVIEEELKFYMYVVVVGDGKYIFNSLELEEVCKS